MTQALRTVFLVLILCASVLSQGSQPSGDRDERLLRLSELTPDANAQTSVMNARVVSTKLYPASFFAPDLKCTSSLVGTRVLLTSAHCVSDGGTVTIEVGINLRKIAAICSRAPGYDDKTNPSPDYALCLTKDEVVETEVKEFETVNTNPAMLVAKTDILLTGFGCTAPGGGGDTSGKVYRVGEAKVETLPAGAENRFVVKGGASLCFGDSGGPSFLQKGKDGGPRIQLAVNAIGTDGKASALASLSTPFAIKFLTDWSAKRGVSICGVGAAKPTDRCRRFS